MFRSMIFVFDQSRNHSLSRLSDWYLCRIGYLPDERCVLRSNA